jgi:hypothetical protein
MGQTVVSENFLIDHAYISCSGQYVKIEAGHKGYYVCDVTTLNVQTYYDCGGPSCAGYGLKSMLPASPTR